MKNFLKIPYLDPLKVSTLFTKYLFFKSRSITGLKF